MRKLGAQLSPPDERDYQVAHFLPATPAPLPAALSFAPLLGPALDQGDFGTCEAHALAGAVMAYDEATIPSVLAGYRRSLSRWDAYQGGRSITVPPPAPNSEGVASRDILEYARTTGLCHEGTWPYNPASPGQPGPDAPAERAGNKLSGYAAVALDAESVKAALHAFGPVLAVIDVYAGFDNLDANNTAHPIGPSRGLHAVALVGWDDSRQAFVLRNSWGTTWGQAGYCWLPYHYPLRECWSAVPALGPEGKPPVAPSEPWWWPLAELLHIVP